MDFIRSIRNKLKDYPRSDADDILMHVLDLSFSELVLFDYEIPDNKKLEINRMVEERIKGEPTAYIIGHKNFFGYEFKVTRDTLIPRQETEILVDAVIRKFKERRFDHKKTIKVLDLGTGSGCILISILKEIQKLHYNVYGVGVDISPGAVDVAKLNAKNLEVNDVNFICCDWGDIDKDEFDIIVSNPPYIPSDDVELLELSVKDFEPRTALDGFSDGLECYRQIAKILPKVMKNNSIIALEYGIGQSSQVMKIMQELFECESIRDLTGKERIIISNSKQ